MLSWRNHIPIQFVSFLMHSRVLCRWLLRIFYFPAAVTRMHIGSGEAGGPEEPQAPLRGPGEGWKQGKTSRFHVPGFKAASSLVCHSHLGTVGCSDCSNSRCNTISSGRTFLLGVPSVIHWGQLQGQPTEDREQQGLLAGRETRGFRLTPTRRCQHPLRPSCAKMVQSATWCSGKCFSFFPI